MGTTNRCDEILDLSLQESELYELTLVAPIGVGTTDYEKLANLPSINGVTLIGNKTSEELHLSDSSQGSGGGCPEGGVTGDILTKRSDDDFDAIWVAPATSVEQDNTRPITSAAVYTEIGNINALLATI